MSSGNRNDKYTYCPQYDEFLTTMKAELKHRLTSHLTLREPKILDAVANTIKEIGRIIYGSNNRHILPYNLSFINHEQIEKLINEWHGPMISKQFKKKFNLGKEGPINYKKFSKDSVNWSDQSSYKVTGQYFFAQHIHAIRKYLEQYCQHLSNLRDGITRTDLTNYSWIYVAVELLKTKAKFRRSKQQPLIRNKTLVNCQQLQKAFKLLNPLFDLEEFKKRVKKRQKGEKKEKGSQYRIDAALFASNFLNLCNNVLNQERKKLGLPLESDERDDDVVIPPYFQDVLSAIDNDHKSDDNEQNEEKAEIAAHSMDIEMENTDTSSDTSFSSPAVSPRQAIKQSPSRVTSPRNYRNTGQRVTPPPLPPFPQRLPQKPPLPPKQEDIERNQQQQPFYPVSCACSDNHDRLQVLYPVPAPTIPPPIPVMPRMSNYRDGNEQLKKEEVVFMSVRIPMRIIRDSNGRVVEQVPICAGFPTVNPHGYGHHRGGSHIGAAQSYRHNPHNPYYKHQPQPVEPRHNEYGVSDNAIYNEPRQEYYPTQLPPEVAHNNNDSLSSNFDQQTSVSMINDDSSNNLSLPSLPQLSLPNIGHLNDNNNNYDNRSMAANIPYSGHGQSMQTFVNASGYIIS